MSDVEITTNNVPRDVIYGHDLTEAERAEFDYLDWSDDEDNPGDGWSRDFVRFRGVTYDLGDTEGIPSQETFPGWDAYITDTFFSGVLFRYPRDGGELDTERVICATYYAR